MSLQVNRRLSLQASACGFGALALNSLLATASDNLAGRSSLVESMPMYPARAKRVIFIFMQGGPSHVDTFDLKPELIRNDGKSIDFTGVRFGDFGKVTQQKLLKPLWKFRQYGDCGRAVSSLFPEIAKHVDDLCFLHGVHTEGVAHGPATLFLHTGATTLIRPAIGSWVMYGLGTENQNLPGFVSLQPSDEKGGPRNYSNAFLPAVFQGTAIGKAWKPVDQMTIEHIRGTELSSDQASRRFALMQDLNELQKGRIGTADSRLDAVIKSYQLAWRMQDAAPRVLDLSEESEATQQAYGIGTKETDDFGRQCLLARRLCEAGVRFVQVNYADESPNPRWDQHSNMPKHEEHAKATDRPVAALLNDLRERGLLEDTLVWWGGEFGRTPFSQGADGRDHNPTGFTMFLAGAGVKPGFAWGATDEIGQHAVEGKVHMHDLHATILHLMGLNHEELTFRHAGRDFRPTDVYGRIVHEIIV